MTESNNGIQADGGWTIPDSAGGTRRRTIVKGAAWTIPAVVVASAAPFAAASTVPTLVTVQVPAAISTCGVFGDLVFQGTSDGTTALPAGTSITVSLAPGATFSDGSSTQAFLTDASGRIVVSGIKGGDTSGSFLATASYQTATATASLVVSEGTYWSINNSDWATFGPAVGAQKVEVGSNTYLVLGSDGILYRATTAEATGSGSANALLPINNPAGVTITDFQVWDGGNYAIGLGSDGSAYRWVSSGGTTDWGTWTKLNAPTTFVDVQIGTNTWVGRDSAGVVWWCYDSSTTLTSIANPAGVSIVDMDVFYNGYYMIARGSDGSAYWWDYSNSAWTVYSGATNVEKVIVGSSTWVVLDAAGVIYTAGTGSSTLTPITNPAGETMKDMAVWFGGSYIMALSDSGKVFEYNGSTWSEVAGAPANIEYISVTSGTWLVLADGDVYTAPTSGTATFTKILGNSDIVQVSSWYGGSYLVARGPSTTVCP